MGDMSLSASMPDEKSLLWGARIGRFLSLGAIHHKELEWAVGRLSFAQTSVFGRVGRAMLTVL